MTGKAPARRLPSVEDFPRWYDEVVARAELAEFGPVAGTMTIRPYGYALWERLRAELNVRIKACGAQNAYFPLFIPRSYLNRGQPEWEGLASELAVVTQAGGAELADPAVVRFSSEMVIGESLARWVNSYRDLPLLINQWANVVRWETDPSLFMRTNEFLWQEGHTVHADEEDSRVYARRIQREVYEDLLANVMAIPALAGIKSRRQRSGSGASNTFTNEAMTGDGKALQMTTSVEGGQNNAKKFGIQFLSSDGKRELAWTTSWGTSTRLIGGLIMVHGDSAGLCLPPALAPTQVVVIAETAEVVAATHMLASELRDGGLRVVADDRADLPRREREVQWEVKGVPLRIDVSAHQMEAGETLVTRRLFGGPATALPLRDLTARVVAMVDDEQRLMLELARGERDARITEVETVESAVEAAGYGWAKLPASALGETGEEELSRSGVTVRCLQRMDGSMPDDDAEPDLVAFAARAY